MSADAATTKSVTSDSTERPKSAVRALMLRMATDRPKLLVVLIAVLLLLMAILEPTTFARPANAAVVLLDTAQTALARAVEQARRASAVVGRLRRLVERPDLGRQAQPVRAVRARQASRGAALAVDAEREDWTEF